MDEVQNPNEWMAGYPPKSDRVIRFNNGSFYGWPQLRWSFSNMQQLVPTKLVWRGAEEAKLFEDETIDLSTMEIEADDGRRLSFDETLTELGTDSLFVLYQGKKMHESYAGAAHPNKPHTLMSCAKSFAGLIAEMLIEDGALDEGALIPHYLPELSDTAWRDATLRQVLDMQISMDFEEDYTDPNSEVWKYIRAGGMVPRTPDAEGPESLCEYLPRVGPKGAHGKAFAYLEPNINVLTWIIQRVANKDLNDLLSEKVWQHIGAEHDAMYMLDPNGMCTTAGATLRDYARFGEYLRTAPALSAIFQKLSKGGDRDKFAAAGLPHMKGGSYISQWWIRHLAHGNVITARGVHGQFLYIDPEKELVMVHFGSGQQVPSKLYDYLIMPLFDTITKTVCGD